MPDFFAARADSVEGPARKLAVLTPSDTVDVTDTPKALLVTANGTLSVMAADDVAAVPLGTYAVGAILPIRVKRIMATGTTASVVGLF